MKKSHKIILILTLVLSLLYSITTIFSFLWKKVNSYTLALNLNWGIALPNTDAKELFGYSEPSFHGDGIRYHIIDYPIENESVASQNTASQLEKIFTTSQLPTKEQVEKVNQLLEHININENIIPTFENCELIYRKQPDHSFQFPFYLLFAFQRPLYHQKSLSRTHNSTAPYV